MSISKKVQKATATTTDLFDIDQHLHKLAGSQNYMNQVATITGDIFEVNMDYWLKKNTQICNCDDNILTLLKHIAKLQLKKGEVDEIDKDQRERNKEKYKELFDIADTYEKEHNKMDMKHKAITTDKKKGRKHIGDGYRAKDIMQTEWWKCIRTIEKAINEYLADLIGKNYGDQENLDSNIEKNADVNVIAIKARYAKNPELQELKTIFSCPIDDGNMKPFMLLREYCNVIIYNYMLPAYNVKQRILNNFDKLDKIFKSKQALALTDGQHFQTEDVVSLLSQFIIAKYRKEVTGNTSYYAHMFFNVIGNEDVSNISPSRLLDLMDNLDLSSLGDKNAAYKFAMSAKDLMKKIASGEELNAEEAIRDIRKTFDYENIDKEAEKEKEKVKELEDIDL